MHGAETCTVYKAGAQRFHIYKMYCLSKKLIIKGQQFIPNKFLQEKSKLPGMYNILAHHNLRWSGDLNRLKNSKLPKQIQYSQLRQGSHKAGRTKLWHKDIKRNREVINISLGNACPKIKKRLEEKKIRISSSDTMDSYIYIYIYIYILCKD